jgi:hypothetical protein
MMYLPILTWNKRNLNGSIEHKKFFDWKLDLDITSKRLLVLDTEDSEDAAYLSCI